MKPRDVASAVRLSMSLWSSKEGPKLARNRQFDQLVRDNEFWVELGKDLKEDPLELKSSELKLPSKSEVFACGEYVLTAYSQTKLKMPEEHKWFEYLVKGKTIRQIYRMAGRGSSAKISDDLERFSGSIINIATVERITTLLTLR